MECTFQLFHSILSIVGIPFYAETGWDSKFWLFLQIFTFFVGFLTLVFTTGFVVVNFSNLHLMIQGVCIWATALMMFITYGICLFFRYQFRMFLNEMGFKDMMIEMPLIEYVLKMKQGRKLYLLKVMVIHSQEELLRLTRTLFKIYIGSVWLCAVLYLCSPIYTMIVTEDQSLRLLAFDMLFPWSLENFKIYVATFTFNAYCGFISCIAYPGLQLTIFLLVGQIIRQLKVLTFILLNMDDIVKELVGERSPHKQQYCSIILSQCVDHYIKLKRFSNNLNVICRPFYLALILDAIMVVCVSSVKIAISNKLSPDTVKYYIHGSCFIFMVLMFCLLGQTVDNECEKLELAVTEKWYIFDKNHKTNVRIFKMALSQRMPIYIFGSINLLLPTFTWFIRTGMSFFTLVMSVLE